MAKLQMNTQALAMADTCATVGDACHVIHAAALLAEDECAERFLMRMTHADKSQADGAAVLSVSKGKQLISTDENNSQQPNSSLSSSWRRTTQEEADARDTFARSGHIPPLFDSPDPADSRAQASYPNSFDPPTDPSTAPQRDLPETVADVPTALDYALERTCPATPPRLGSPSLAMASGAEVTNLPFSGLQPVDYEDVIIPTQLEGASTSLPADSDAEPTAVEEAARPDALVDTCATHPLGPAATQPCESLEISQHGTAPEGNIRSTDAQKSRLAATQHTARGSSIEVQNSVNGVGGASVGIVLQSDPNTGSRVDVVSSVADEAAAIGTAQAAADVSDGPTDALTEDRAGDSSGGRTDAQAHDSFAGARCAPVRDMSTSPAPAPASFMPADRTTNPADISACPAQLVSTTTQPTSATQPAQDRSQAAGPGKAETPPPASAHDVAAGVEGSQAARAGKEKSVPTTPLPDATVELDGSVSHSATQPNSSAAATEGGFSADALLQVPAARRIAAHLSTQDEAYIEGALCSIPRSDSMHGLQAVPVAEARTVAGTVPRPGGMHESQEAPVAVACPVAGTGSRPGGMHHSQEAPVAEARAVAARLSTQALCDMAMFSQCTVQESPSHVHCGPPVALDAADCTVQGIHPSQVRGTPMAPEAAQCTVQESPSQWRSGPTAAPGAAEWVPKAGAFIATARDSQPSSSCKSPPEGSDPPVCQGGGTGGDGGCSASRDANCKTAPPPTPATASARNPAKATGDQLDVACPASPPETALGAVNWEDDDGEQRRGIAAAGHACSATTLEAPAATGAAVSEAAGGPRECAASAEKLSEDSAADAGVAVPQAAHAVGKEQGGAGVGNQSSNDAGTVDAERPDPAKPADAQCAAVGTVGAGAAKPTGAQCAGVGPVAAEPPEPAKPADAQCAGVGSQGTVRESESCHKGHVDNESQGVTSKAPPVAAGVARAGEAGAAMGGQSVWTVPETATQGGYRRDDGDPSQKSAPTKRRACTPVVHPTVPLPAKDATHSDGKHKAPPASSPLPQPHRTRGAVIAVEITTKSTPRSPSPSLQTAGGISRKDPSREPSPPFVSPRRILAGAAAAGNHPPVPRPSSKVDRITSQRAELAQQQRRIQQRAASASGAARHGASAAPPRSWVSVAVERKNPATKSSAASNTAAHSINVHAAQRQGLSAQMLAHLSAVTAPAVGARGTGAAAKQASSAVKSRSARALQEQRPLEALPGNVAHKRLRSPTPCRAHCSVGEPVRSSKAPKAACHVTNTGGSPAPCRAYSSTGEPVRSSKAPQKDACTAAGGLADAVQERGDAAPAPQESSQAGSKTFAESQLSLQTWVPQNRHGSATATQKPTSPHMPLSQASPKSASPLGASVPRNDVANGTARNSTAMHTCPDEEDEAAFSLPQPRSGSFSGRRAEVLNTQTADKFLEASSNVDAENDDDAAPAWLDSQVDPDKNMSLLGSLGGVPPPTRGSEGLQQSSVSLLNQSMSTAAPRSMSAPVGWTAGSFASWGSTRGEESLSEPVPGTLASQLVSWGAKAPRRGGATPLPPEPDAPAAAHRFAAEHTRGLSSEPSAGRLGDSLTFLLKPIPSIRLDSHQGSQDIALPAPVSTPPADCTGHSNKTLPTTTVTQRADRSTHSSKAAAAPSPKPRGTPHSTPTKKPLSLSDAVRRSPRRTPVKRAPLATTACDEPDRPRHRARSIPPSTVHSHKISRARRSSSPPARLSRCARSTLPPGVNPRKNSRAYQRTPPPAPPSKSTRLSRTPPQPPTSSRFNSGGAARTPSLGTAPRRPSSLAPTPETSPPASRTRRAKARAAATPPPSSSATPAASPSTTRRRADVCSKAGATHVQTPAHGAQGTPSTSSSPRSRKRSPTEPAKSPGSSALTTPKRARCSSSTATAQALQSATPPHLTPAWDTSTRQRRAALLHVKQGVCFQLPSTDISQLAAQQPMDCDTAFQGARECPETSITSGANAEPGTAQMAQPLAAGEFGTRALAAGGSSVIGVEVVWGEVQRQSSWKTLYCSFTCAGLGTVKVGDCVTISELRHSPPKLLWVKHIWHHHRTGEQCLSGLRVFPLDQTPWHCFTPTGIPKQRCAVLSDEVHTAPIGSAAQRLPVLFRAVDSGAEAEVAAALAALGERSLLCHLQTTEDCGVDNLSV